MACYFFGMDSVNRRKSRVTARQFEAFSLKQFFSRILKQPYLQIYM